MRKRRDKEIEGEAGFSRSKRRLRDDALFDIKKESTKKNEEHDVRYFKTNKSNIDCGTTSKDPWAPHIRFCLCHGYNYHCITNSMCYTAYLRSTARCATERNRPATTMKPETDCCCCCYCCCCLMPSRDGYEWSTGDCLIIIIMMMIMHRIESSSNVLVVITVRLLLF